MKHYTATYNAGEASQNIRSFVKNHHDEFLNLLKTVGPYLIILFFISVTLTQYAMEDIMEQLPKDGQQDAIQQNTTLAFTSPYMLLNHGVSILMGYFFAVIAISWHRLILLGKENYQPMKPFDPQKHEIEFLITLAIISAVIPFSLSFLITTQFGIDSGLMMLLFPISILLVYAYFKISFYFPAKAVNASIDFKTSFHLTKGYFWKMIAAYFFASWRVTLLMTGFIMGISIIASIFMALLAGSINLVQALIYAPIVLYFQPLITVIGVSVLSNYYQHALQNKEIPQIDSKQDGDMNKTRKALDDESKH